MRSYLIRRLFIAILALLGVTVGAFSMLHLAPGDPISLLVSERAAESAGSDPKQAMELFRSRYGLDKPLPVQYLNYLSQLLHGDLGSSIFQGRAVLDIILEQFPHTFQLAFASIFIAIAIGIPAGIIAAWRHNSWLDSTTMTFSLLGVSLPTFWQGLMLILLFSVAIQWFPTSGQGGVRYLVLPAAALGSSHAAILSRLTRSSMLEVLHEGYINTARGKGLRERVVLLRHAFPNAIVPVVTVVGLQFGRMLAGTFIIEIVFARQGLGNVLVSAILNRDFPLAQGTILFTAAFYVLVNLIVDMTYSYLDPRIQYG
jgi:peptide/nickel transport system permease protein